MNERVKKIRELSVETRPYVSAERACLLTDFYRSGVPERVSVPVARALAFKNILDNRSLYFGEGEIIVGERGPAPQAAPTFPELCCHSLEDFEVLATRERTRFAVSEEVKRVYRDEIIPFWKGRNIRERLFSLMSPEWHKAFAAGVFTEFMEQRAFGHAILDDKIYRHGFLEFKRRIAAKQAELDAQADGSPEKLGKLEELKAMDICCDAVVAFAGRYAEKARELANGEADPARRKELERIAEVCSRVPAEAPQTFHEALQAYWFVHLGVITELNTWDSYDPGRLDQHLFPFYERELNEGTLTREGAKELLECFWIKFNNQPAPPKVGVTEEQSGTYQDFALINVGGVKVEDGSDAVNAVSYLILEVVAEMRLIQPSVCVQLSRENPAPFLARACEVIRAGFGQPSMFNTDIIIKEMLRDGKTLEDARAGGPSGCVTVSAFGKESCTLTGYMNWPKIAELACFDGIDPKTGERLGPATGDVARFSSFEEFLNAYSRQLEYFVDLKIAGNSSIERLYAAEMPAPFMSVIMDDCIARAKDYHDGGARYNPTYIQGVGLGTVADAITAVKFHVFDRKTLSMAELLKALRDDFAGCEDLRRRLATRTPAYGNDDAYADEVAETVFMAYFGALDGKPNTKGGKYRVNLLPTTVHTYCGSVTGALPNGRKAGAPVSEGISPTQGADVNGPTAVMKSAACFDHSLTGGTLLNMKFNPQVLEGEGLARLAALIRGYFTLNGHHVQFNVIGGDTLRAAQKDPESHRNLIVRVAGYSDYFVDVGKALQEEIISRTEQTGV
jgi:pyruvate formate-lyase/glycerol dehydratase family glycyl radical enzyme